MTAALLALGGVTACDQGGAGDQGEVRLKFFFWGGDKRIELTQKVLDLYHQRHPEVSFDVAAQPNSGYFDKLAERIDGGDAPDLFQIDDNYLTEFAQRDYLLDLGPFVADDRIDLTQVSNGLVRYGRVGSAQVGVAAAENTAALVYDKTLLDRLGVATPANGMDYPRYLAWAAQISEKSAGAVAGTMDPSADYKAFWLWLRSQGKEFYAGSALGFTDADVTAWFTMWKDARADGITPAAPVVHEANAGDATKQLVVTGQAATSFMWSNQLPEMQQKTKNELGIVAYPGGESAAWARASMYWSGYRDTAHADVVADVIDFLVNDPEAAEILGTERGLAPNLQNRRALEISLTDPVMKASIAYTNEMSTRYGKAPLPPPKGHGAIRAALVKAAEAAQSETLTPALAATQFVTEANAALG
ncbi:multiple sugar transport system substrate-binding protein [Catenuloplanes nepalensis]|uniref:Multiple sugar transport system substrate-binding protein n=1 Tax=Catenuloplanes nepalensis TaxID=587533 RepID=A0ABT9N1Q3_9ACTN|nr:extracellular solute-binding protein [Catenuloplanes nepalensis]MDP9797620.1 multiple sugar transport system substrate-binding protein [Catenuloplanes nepalensis]